jgi:hypothetical protein
MINDDIIDIFYPASSPGLDHCAQVMRSAITKISGGRLKTRFTQGNPSVYRREKRNDPPPDHLVQTGRVAIFIERVIERPFMAAYKSRILLPNPEWLWPSDLESAQRMIDAVFHRSRMSAEMLTPHLPNARHYQVGFTSREPTARVASHDRYAHFRGKATMRHSQLLIDLWKKRADLPELSVQAYGPDIGLQSGRWLSGGNLRMFLGYFPTDEAYFDALSASGIHLCTSSTEGFGHYINESRAMGAVVVTLDAPPMNELVTPDFGILIPAVASTPVNMGVSYETTLEHLEAAVDRVQGLSAAQRAEMGRGARNAFEQGRSTMLARMTDALNGEW